MENVRPLSQDRYASPTASPSRSRFIPSKPALEADDSSSSPLSCRSNGTVVARLKQQLFDPNASSADKPSFGKRAALSPSTDVPHLEPSNPVVKARVTSGAIARKKATLPGAERADNPVQVKKHASAFFRPNSSLGRSVPASVVSPLPSFSSNGSLVSIAASHAYDESQDQEGSADLQQLVRNTPLSIDSVSVCVRIRPTTHEIAWQIDDAANTVLFRGSERVETPYRFDNVTSAPNNQQVYNMAAKSLIRSVMEGFDGVVFAYGQTASGKTFTLSGTPTNPGIIPLSVHDVFAYIRKHPAQEFLLRASYLEIYNESLKDLLNPETAGLVKIRQDENKRFFASPLREEVVTSVAQVEALLLRGEANRHTGTTDFNARSSRSHTVFQMTIESREAGHGSRMLPRCTTPQPRRATSRAEPSAADSSVTISRLCLIDLAGSEKATSQQERRLEGAFINKSLLTLEKVVSALTEDKQRSHIPFRDSKLTQLLQPSLSGTSRVSVICTVNPSVTSVEESRSTLKFATRVKKVAVSAEKNEILDDRALLVKYRNQIADLQAQLARKNAEAALIPPTPLRPSDDHRSSKQSAELKKQSEAIIQQIASLQTLFVSSSNMDCDTLIHSPRPISPARAPEEPDEAESMMEKLLDAADRISEQEDMIGKLKSELFLAREEIARRPCIAYDAPRDLKDEKIASMEKTLREYEVIFANTDAEEAAARERKLVEREYRDRLQTLERDKHARIATEGKLTELLASERRRCKHMEKFIIAHLVKQAERLGSDRRESSGDSAAEFLHNLPSIMDEEADLTRSFATMMDLAAEA